MRAESWSCHCSLKKNEEVRDRYDKDNSDCESRPRVNRTATARRGEKQGACWAQTMTDLRDWDREDVHRVVQLLCDVVW